MARKPPGLPGGGGGILLLVLLVIVIAVLVFWGWSARSPHPSATGVPPTLPAKAVPARH